MPKYPIKVTAQEAAKPSPWEERKLKKGLVMNVDDLQRAYLDVVGLNTMSI